MSATSPLLAIKLKKKSATCGHLTMNNRQRCSLRAPRQPRKPVTMVIPPATSSRLAAERDGKDRGREENSACVKDSQTPTPNKPHPPSFSGNGMSNQCQNAAFITMLRSKNDDLACQWNCYIISEACSEHIYIYIYSPQLFYLRNTTLVEATDKSQIYFLGKCN